MSKWSWLMIALAILDSIQWTSSVTRRIYNDKDNTHPERSLWHSRTFHQSKNIPLFNGPRDISNKSSLDHEIEYRSKINHANVRSSPLAFRTKRTPLKNEYSSRNTSTLLAMFFTNSTDQEMLRMAYSEFSPEPDAVEKCSANSSYCDKIDNYPRQEILQIFKDSNFSSNNKHFMENIEDDISANHNKDRKKRSLNQLRPVCDSKIQILYPEAALSINNKWLYVVQPFINTSNSFRQGIKVEICSHDKDSNDLELKCRFNDYLPEGISSVCVQKFIYKKMITVSNSKEIYYEQFLFPSCCTCMYNTFDDF